MVSEGYASVYIWAGSAIYADRREKDAGVQAGGATLVYRKTDSWKVNDGLGKFSGSGRTETWHMDKIKFKNGEPFQDNSGVFNGQGGAVNMEDGSKSISYSELLSTSNKKFIQDAVRQTNRTLPKDQRIRTPNLSCVSGQYIVEISAKYYIDDVPDTGFTPGNEAPPFSFSINEFVHKPWTNAVPSFWSRQPYSSLYFYVIVNWREDPKTQNVEVRVSTDLQPGPSRLGRPAEGTLVPSNGDWFRG